MIETLHIKNFQVFEDIEIKGLHRVNLIAGKNNAGKTAMLEALRILAARGEATVVNNILKNRGQFTPSWDSSYEALFNRKVFRKDGADAEVNIQINRLLIVREKNYEKISFDYFVFDADKYPDGDAKLSLKANYIADNPLDKAIYIPFNFELLNLENLWKNIVLRPLEDDVIEILKSTVEPRLIRMDMTGGAILVRLQGEENPVPLSSLGDGVQRMLTLAIGLVSAKGKMLLIDEFEAGLHHSVQKKLWEMVFEYATKWDIQVFATTHSQDTVRNFYYVASRPQYEKEATFLRLQFDRLGVHEAQVYDMQRLEQSLEIHLETR
ncbi:MAG: ATP-binding protein [Saprospiraceae bacterium]|nr:ATP-binding protein [Saprospiraceae bacterium]MCF8248655.1 ATP-binding protein [Saprospiraceae bacterium]MCF8278855.1 ATP-binding protein [Bacteroidales bacterium]MCF8310655.1 ATP-binding protein [Saprospiraceae bacterium]MCF8439214.1 ATP-binding protein [Saprospiraceae bacterium]